MSNLALRERPAQTEYAPYYGTYIDLVPEGDVVETLARQIAETLALLEPLDEQQGEYRYARGKWSVKDIVGHLCDTERIFSLRALHFARNDPAPLPGMEQDPYVLWAESDRRALHSLLTELAAIRNATLALFRGLDPGVWSRRGTADGVEFTVRSLAYIIAGHELHHRRVIRERYLGHWST